MPSNKYKYTDTEQNILQDSGEDYTPSPSSKNKGFVFESEDDRLIKDATRSDIEKLQLFTKMIRRNALFNKFNPIA